MTRNPVNRIRVFGNAALVLVVCAAMAAAVLQRQDIWPGWPWLIGAVAIGYSLLSAWAHLRHPDAAEAAWDEQNSMAYRDSLAFGYWAVMTVFLGLFALVLAGIADPATAFFWIAPVLAIAPPLHYLWSVFRGRAE